MTLRKIADLPVPCRDPDHRAPKFVALAPGIYEHTCPSCGEKTVFTVDPSAIF